MAVRKEKDYLIDIAARHKYRNQTEAYHKKYLEWRTDPKNPFGYKFVHDSRVRTYVDGEGFLEETPLANERTALVNCYRVMGAALLIMAAVAFVKLIVMQLLFAIPNGGRLYRPRDGETVMMISDSAAYTLLTLNILEYILPIFFIKAATRLPRKIAVPLRKSLNISSTNAVMMMLVIMAIGRVVNGVIAELLFKIKLDIPYYDYIRPTGTTATVICGLGQHVIVAIFIEVLFRGYLLQMFRQFGDSLAIIVTSIAGCLTLYDISQAGYLFCVGIFIGTVTIRSGSIKNACIMRSIARFLNYLLSFLPELVGEFWGKVAELSACILIMFTALIVYMRLNSRQRWSFDVSRSGTYLTLSAKLRQLLVSPLIWMWIVTALAMSVLLVRIV
ncbi:MAG: CPBP family intramembrane metalloprotease [Ruminococcus sp.]|nr:CPBP family intramembrane metalloprotease [Ruminococcus sp.]